MVDVVGAGGAVVGAGARVVVGAGGGPPSTTRKTAALLFQCCSHDQPVPKTPTFTVWTSRGWFCGTVQVTVNSRVTPAANGSSSNHCWLTMPRVGA